jgi:hypothetical protein
MTAIIQAPGALPANIKLGWKRSPPFARNEKKCFLFLVLQHSGIYTCSVSDTVSQSLRLHIIDGKALAPKPYQGNTKGGSITVLLTSCLTGLESAVGELTMFVFICKTDKSKPVKQEVNGTVILPPLVFPALH